VPTDENFLVNLPDDKEALKAILHSLLQESARQEKRAEEQSKRADELYLENLWLQVELARYKKATYGPRADRLSESQLAQMLLEFAEAFDQKPLHLEDLPQTEPEPELRKVKRRKGRRALANFENLPVLQTSCRQRSGRTQSPIQSKLIGFEVHERFLFLKKSCELQGRLRDDPN
jgi:hypothetical protein